MNTEKKSSKYQIIKQTQGIHCLLRSSCIHVLMRERRGCGVCHLLTVNLHFADTFLSSFIYFFFFPYFPHFLAFLFLFYPCSLIFDLMFVCLFSYLISHYPSFLILFCSSSLSCYYIIFYHYLLHYLHYSFLFFSKEGNILLFSST